MFLSFIFFKKLHDPVINSVKKLPINGCGSRIQMIIYNYAVFELIVHIMDIVSK